jgi:hypothetical protein
MVVARSLLALTALNPYFHLFRPTVHALRLNLGLLH